MFIESTEYDYDNIIYPVPFNNLVQNRSLRYKDFDIPRQEFPSFVRYGKIQPALNRETEFVVVTGASDNHALSLISFLYSTLLACPQSPLVIVDYGLSSKSLTGLWGNVSQIYSIRQQLGSFAPIYYRKFNFDNFPKWFQLNTPSRGGYAWKVVSIYDVLTEFKGLVVWSDAGNVFNNLGVEIQRTRRNGFFSGQAGHSVGVLTHDSTYQFIEEMGWKTNVRSIKDKRSCNGANLFFDYWNNTVMTNVVYPYVKCSYTKRCIDPNGSNRRNHRQDQSIISIFVHLFGVEQACSVQYGTTTQFHRDYEFYGIGYGTNNKLIQMLSEKYNITVNIFYHVCLLDSVECSTQIHKKAFFHYLVFMIPMYCLFVLISIFLLVSTVENHENWINVSRMGMKEHIAFPVEVKRGLRLRSGKKYLITVAITDDSPHLREKVKTTIDMLSLYQKYYRIKPVIFSQSDAVLDYATHKKVTVISEVDRNEFGVPIYRSLLSSMKKRYRFLLYGYMNSDILMDPLIFSAIDQMDMLHKKTNIPVF